LPRSGLPVEDLVSEHANLPTGEEALLFGSASAAFIRDLAGRARPGLLHILDTDLRGQRQARASLQQAKNGRLVETGILPIALHGRCAYALVLAPPQRDLARRWLLEAYAALGEGGTLLIAGAKAEGIEPIIADTQALFGQAHVLGYRKGCRVATAVRRTPGQLLAWASEPGIAAGTWQDVAVQLPQGAITLYSLPGIFAYDRLDAGTALLLQQLVLRGGERVLDLGCGYGVIGVAAALAGATRVEMCDVNLLAVAAAQVNAERLVPERCTVYAADGLEGAKGKYDLIVTNPPFHQGKTTDYSIAEGWITQAKGLLANGGRLVIVVNRFLAHERLLRSQYEQVQLLADDPRYRVWEAR
jgi:16S rRNA (guanine1207-N2)-methyltransferase